MGETAKTEAPDMCTACVAQPGLKDPLTLCPVCGGTPSRKERERLAKLEADEAKPAKAETKKADEPKKVEVKEEDVKPPAIEPTIDDVPAPKAEPKSEAKPAAKK